MANKHSVKRSVDSDIFKTFLKRKGIPIQTLANDIGVHDRTIHRICENGEITTTIAIEICRFFNEPCSVLFGPDESPSWKKTKGYLD